MVGSVAGCFDPTYGYNLIRVDGTLYRSARLAWFYVHGRWPEPQIDHKNRNRSDDRLENLREANSKIQHDNMGIRSDNISGFKGVSWDASRKKWVAVARGRGLTKFAGYFDNVEDAAHARDLAMISHGF